VANQDDRILDIIHKTRELFIGKGLTLSVAESCTGGLISHFLTLLPGSSSFFKAGVVAYSEEMKKKILGVSPDIISSYGIVSEETAREMAEKVRDLTGSDYSVSTTGNLGPDVLEQKPRGLVYIALSREGLTTTKELKLERDREQNKEAAAMEALRFLLEMAAR